MALAGSQFVKFLPYLSFPRSLPTPRQQAALQTLPVVVSGGRALFPSPPSLHVPTAWGRGALGICPPPSLCSKYALLGSEAWIFWALQPLALVYRRLGMCCVPQSSRGT